MFLIPSTLSVFLNIKAFRTGIKLQSLFLKNGKKAAFLLCPGSTAAFKLPYVSYFEELNHILLYTLFEVIIPNHIP
jgi:hypothetical protein